MFSKNSKQFFRMIIHYKDIILLNNSTTNIKRKEKKKHISI